MGKRTQARHKPKLVSCLTLLGNIKLLTRAVEKVDCPVCGCKAGGGFCAETYVDYKIHVARLALGALLT